MKYFFLILLFLFYAFSYSQTVSEESLTEFIEVRVHQGGTVYGTNVYKLMYEGLLLGTHGLYGRSDETKFIPRSELNKRKVVDIQYHIRKYGIFRDDFEPRPYEDTVVVDYDTIITEIKTTAFPDKFIFIVIAKNKYSHFFYISFDKKVKALIDLLNALIPESDRERFGIKNKRCKRLHWYRKRSKG